MQQLQGLESFTSVLKTESTKTQYVYHLDRYRKFRQAANFADLTSGTSIQIEDSITAYLQYLKNLGKPRNSIELAVYPVLKFYSRARIQLNREWITEQFPPARTIGGSTAYTTEQIKSILATFGTSSDLVALRNRALVHVLACSGIRLGALVMLTLNDWQKHNTCDILTIYANTKEQYHTFLTKQASTALNAYVKAAGNTITPKSRLFGLSYSGAKMILWRAIIEARIREGKADPITKRYQTSIAHSMRKRFATILKNHPKANHVKVELLLGHSARLDKSYYKPTIKDLQTEFAMNAKTLTIT